MEKNYENKSMNITIWKFLKYYCQHKKMYLPFELCAERDELLEIDFSNVVILKEFQQTLFLYTI